MAPKKGPLETYGNKTTMNLNDILYRNILASRYFSQDLMEIETFEKLVAEMYRQVTDLEPFMPGIGNKATSAFCLLYKLYTLKITENQLVALLDNQDSSYVRGIGFLWLRYCCPPKELWSWIEPYIDDEEPIKPGWAQNSAEITMGEFIRRLLTEQKYYNTIMPRIPVPVAREIHKHLEENPLSKARNEMLHDDHGSGTYGELSPSAERNRSSSRRRDSRSRSRGGDNVLGGTRNSYRDLDVPRGDSHGGPRSRTERDRGSGRDSRERSERRERERSHDYRAKALDRSRERGHSRDEGNGRDRSRDHESTREKVRDYRDKGRSRDGDRRRSRSRERVRDYRDKDRRRDGDRRRSRSRSRDRRRDSRDRR
eukprot:CFRG7478T1